MSVVGTIRRHTALVEHALLGLLAFVPLLLTAPGRVAADTRQDFYVDPADFVARALTLWDPQVHLGTVTHSNIGNVFPMGSFFALTDLVGVAPWVAQRLWVGLLLFSAGAGVLFLARSIRWSGPGVGSLVAAVVYMLTPYTLQYAGRTSVLLLPFAALPWTIGLVERSLRTGGWRHPAVLALVAMVVSGANVAAALLVGVGPLLWLAVAVTTRAAPWRRALGVVGKAALLTLGTCALWLAALLVEARYGLNVLAYTETVQQVATTSTAPEVLRGLGYWLFYGLEAREPNAVAATHYLESTPVLLATFLLPGLAIAAALTTRWRYRSACIAMVVVGVVVAVGTYPFEDPSLAGGVGKDLAEGSTLGLALRSSTRVVPVVVLGVALLLGAGVGALWARRGALGLVATGVVGALALVGATGMLAGDVVDDGFSRPSEIPAYWHAAARDLDRGDDGTRVLEIPGSQFAAYRWGSTYETPVLATLLDRPTAAREQIPFGSAPAADLLSALDRRLQEGVLDPGALAPLARLLAAGDVVLRSDLEYERYAAPRPRGLWALLRPTPEGLGEPRAYGPRMENRAGAHVPLVDPQTLGVPVGAEDPPPVAVFPVREAPPVVHGAPSARPTLLDGDGEGIVDAAAGGVVTGDRLVLYGAWLVDHPRELARAIDAGADLVVTDTNRRRDRRWRSTRDTAGLTDRAGNDQPRTGQGEAELVVFPGTDDSTRSVAVQRGATVDASRYGGLVTFEPHQRAAAALDGDPTTAWELDTLIDPVGEHLTIRADEPVTTDHLDLLQAQGGIRTRPVTEVALRFDGGDPVRVALDDRSRTVPGQRVRFRERTFSRLDVEITGTTLTPEAPVHGVSGTGFAEITVPGVRLEELVRVPRTLVRSDATTNEHRLVYVLTRLRANPAEPDRGDEEPTLARLLEVPDVRSFSVSGTARLSAAADDATVDALVGTTDGTRVRASSRLPGALDQRGRAAVDGDRATRWTTSPYERVGATLDVELPAPTTIDHLDLAVVADGRHSVPTRLTVTVDGDAQVVALPPVADRAEPDAVVDVPVALAPRTGRTLRVTVEEVRELTTPDAVSGLPQPLPVSIAELGAPGVAAAPLRTDLAATCRTDLLRVDGTAVPVRVLGTTADAIARRPLRLEGCDPGLPLAAGERTLRSTPGRDTGIDGDRVVLASERGGGPVTPDAAGRPTAPPAPAPTGAVTVLEDDATHVRVRVAASEEPVWLVLGQSHTDAWEASGPGGSLGEPVLVDGYANGWLLPPSSAAREVVLDWTPQGTIRLAAVVALLAMLGCLLLAWRSRRRAAGHDEGGEEPALDLALDASGTPRTRVVVAVALGAAAVVLVLVDVVAAGLVGGVVAAALVWRRGRVLLAVTALALVAAGTLGVVYTQERDDRRVNYDWTRDHEDQSAAVLAGLLLVGADPVVRRVRRGRVRTPSEDDPDG